MHARRTRICLNNHFKISIKEKICLVRRSKLSCFDEDQQLVLGQYIKIGKILVMYIKNSTKKSKETKQYIGYKWLSSWRSTQVYNKVRKHLSGNLLLKSDINDF